MEHGKHMMPGMPPKEMKGKMVGMGKEQKMKAVKRALKKKKK